MKAVASAIILERCKGFVMNVESVFDESSEYDYDYCYTNHEYTEKLFNELSLYDQERIRTAIDERWLEYCKFVGIDYICYHPDKYDLAEFINRYVSGLEVSAFCGSFRAVFSLYDEQMGKAIERELEDSLDASSVTVY